MTLLSAYYSDSLLVIAHKVILLGYQKALAKCRTDIHEEVITGHICAAIERELPDCRAPRWLRNVCIKENPPQNTGTATGKRRVMPDLVVELTHGSRPQFIFEAKRLQRPNFPASKYLGKDGIGCFIDSQYAPHYREAGMLGYVQGDSVAWWATSLKKLQAENDPTDCNVIEGIECEWKSTHNRSDLKPIDIYHILLDCTHSTCKGQVIV